jgi:hypothetical protein
MLRKLILRIIEQYPFDVPGVGMVFPREQSSIGGSGFFLQIHVMDGHI